MKSITLPYPVKMHLPRTDIHKSFAKGIEVYYDMKSFSNGSCAILITPKNGPGYIEQIDFDSIEEAREEGWNI